MRSKSISYKRHYVFDSQKEFEDYFVSKEGAVPTLTADWRTGKVGDWVLADDGCVLQILHQKDIKHPHDRKNYHAHSGICRTVVGTFFQNPKTKMDTDFDKHPNRYSINGKKYDVTRKHATNLTKRERLFIASACSGKSLYDAFLEAYGFHKNWRDRILALTKRKVIMDEIRKSINETAEKLGINLEFIMGGLKKLAVESRDPRAQLGAYRELEDLLRLKKDEPPQLGGMQAPFGVLTGPFEGISLKQLRAIEAEEVATVAEAEIVAEEVNGS